MKACLVLRLAEEEIVKHITTTDPSIPRSAGLILLRSWFLKQPALSRGHHVGPAEASTEEAPKIDIDITRSDNEALSE